MIQYGAQTVTPSTQRRRLSFEEAAASFIHVQEWVGHSLWNHLSFCGLVGHLVARRGRVGTNSRESNAELSRMCCMGDVAAQPHGQGPQSGTRSTAVRLLRHRVWLLSSPSSPCLAAQNQTCLRSCRGGQGQRQAPFGMAQGRIKHELNFTCFPADQAVRIASEAEATEPHCYGSPCSLKPGLRTNGQMAGPPQHMNRVGTPPAVDVGRGK